VYVSRTFVGFAGGVSFGMPASALVRLFVSGTLTVVGFSAAVSLRT
jgi:hypothetical protein